jgi:hypothetical protein
VTRERVADSLRLPVPAVDHRQSLDRKGRAGTVPHELLEASAEARHVAVFEADAHTGVDGEPGMFPCEHVGGCLGVEEPATLVPPDETSADALGERRKVGRSDWASGEEGDAVGGLGVVGPARHENAVGDARMKMDVMVEGRAEAVKERDAADAGRFGTAFGC